LEIVMADIVSPVTLPSGLPDQSDPGTNTSEPSAPSNSTATSGALKGRDPDLIFAGEKIMVNGKEYTVQDGDTLSGIAVKFGLAHAGNQQEILNGVVKLATENGMDLKKMDQEGFEGLQPTATGPQPPNGGATATAPNNTATAPAAQAQNGASATGPKGLSANTTTHNPVDPSLETNEQKTGLQGVLIKDPKAALDVLNGSDNQKSLQPGEADRLREVFQFLVEDKSGSMGADLCQEDKNLFNKWANANGFGG
jgi:LysM repeat protein